MCINCKWNYLVTNMFVILTSNFGARRLEDNLIKKMLIYTYIIPCNF